MISIRVRNVNEALSQGLAMMVAYGIERDSRNGPVVAMPECFSTLYSHPAERVLFNAERNANPYFHFMEAMWMLSGRNDAKFLQHFIPSFNRFSDDGETLNGAYGHRWRYKFNFDQISRAIAELEGNHVSRRVVLEMWAASDLGSKSKDVPCNTHIYFDVRDGKMNMTVANRSNDMIWGAYGANVVHMSMLQQYMAEAVGVPMGWYEQVSNDMHVYTAQYPRDTWAGMQNLWRDYYNPRVVLPVKESMLLKNRGKHAFTPIPIIQKQPLKLLAQFEKFANDPHGYTFGSAHPYMEAIVQPMWFSWLSRRTDPQAALHWADNIEQWDWRIACREWLYRNVKALKE